MAQSTKKSTSTSKTSKKTTSRSSKAKENTPVQTAPPAPPVQPRRREIAAVVFLFLAVFVVISYFNTDGAFILFFSDLMKGLLGWGYWIIAPVFLLVALILAFHRGRPVAFRVFCALMLPIFLAAMTNLMFWEKPIGVDELPALTNQLFISGQALNSGGAVGGLLAMGLESAFSLYGAYPLLIVAFIAFLLISLHFDAQGFANKVKERATAKYDPAMYPEEEPIIVKRPAEKPVKPQPKKPSYDIPLEDEENMDFVDLDKSTLVPKLKSEESVAKVRPRGRSAAKKQETPAPVPFDEPETDTPIAGGFEKFDKVNVGDNFVELKNIKSTRQKSAAAAVSVGEISDPPKEKSKKASKAEIQEQTQAVADEIAANDTNADYVFPPIELLRSGSSTAVDGRDEIAANRERLSVALHSFGINADIVGVTRGPTVTRYDIELEQGVKLSRVTNLAGDLALSLGVVNVRIAPIPDKISTVGIEVPNKIVSTVYLREIIESSKFQNAKSKLSFAIGKDIGGECIVGNISKLPHMLIAGTTGSGKSVCMNSLILSLLYKARPDEVRLIMIDPKMVELGIYNGIPQLYVPVVTDPKKAAGALQWSVVEMLKRYRSFSEVGVRELEAYNNHCRSMGEPTLPRIVIVIDELADLMMAASKEVEESICRVAQMGRAAGMHLVIATQRPSADVITGLMKANIPSRIAFAVSSAMESRIILDQGGAEKLVGMGDMLFAPVGIGKPLRIQGAFVSDEERENVIQFIKENSGASAQNSEIEDFMNKAAEDKNSDSDSKGSGDSSGGAGDYDDMLPQAVEVVLETKSCSVSMLQRRLKLGYSRAARIVDQMEELGVVGPYEGAKPRSVVVDRDGWHQIQVSLGLASDEDMALASTMSENSDGSYEE